MRDKGTFRWDPCSIPNAVQGKVGNELICRSNSFSTVSPLKTLCSRATNLFSPSFNMESESRPCHAPICIVCIRFFERSNSVHCVTPTNILWFNCFISLLCNINFFSPVNPFVHPSMIVSILLEWSCNSVHEWRPLNIPGFNCLIWFPLRSSTLILIKPFHAPFSIRYIWLFVRCTFKHALLRRKAFALITSIWVFQILKNRMFGGSTGTSVIESSHGTIVPRN